MHRNKRFSALIAVFAIFAMALVSVPEAEARKGAVGRAWRGLQNKIRNVLISRKARQPGYQLLGPRKNTAKWRKQVQRLVSDNPKKVQAVLAHSRTNGEYAMVTDLHWGFGDPGSGRVHKREDFRQDLAFKKRLETFNKKFKNKNRTLSSGGDWLEMMEAVPANASRKQVYKAVERIIDGHTIAAAALFKAVAVDGMRFVYTRGNHDVHVVDPRLRTVLMNKIARVGLAELAKSKTVTKAQKAKLLKDFHTRVAYVGIAAPFGKKGEVLHTHGDGYDPFNSWKHWALPLTPNAKGGYSLRTTFGWEMVQQLYKFAEAKDNWADNHEEKGPSGNVMREALFTGPKGLWKFRNFLHHAFTKNSEVQYSKTQHKEMEKIGREAMTQWVRATGFARIQNAQRKEVDRLSDAEWGKRMTEVSRTHKPFHEHVRNATFTVNVLNLLRPRFKRGLPKMNKWIPFLKVSRINELKKQAHEGETKVVGALMSRTNVSAFVTGHDHAPEVVNVTALGRRLTYMNAGTWVRNKGSWGLNVGRFSTNGEGKFSDGRMTETNKDTGGSSKSVLSFDHRLPSFMKDALPKTHQEVAPK